MFKIRVCGPVFSFPKCFTSWVKAGKVSSHTLEATLSLWSSVTQSYDQAHSTLQVPGTKEIPRSLPVGGVWRRKAEKQKQEETKC